MGMAADATQLKELSEYQNGMQWHVNTYTLHLVFRAIRFVFFH
jgi:hypothetical protein